MSGPGAHLPPFCSRRSPERSSLLMRSCFSGREFFFMDFLSFGDPSRRCSRSSSRRWGCGDSCRRWHSADSTGLRRDPEYQLPRRLRRAADFGGGALGGRRTRPVLLSIGAKSSSARGGAVAAHFLVPNRRSGIQTGLAYTWGSAVAAGHKKTVKIAGNIFLQTCGAQR